MISTLTSLSPLLVLIAIHLSVGRVKYLNPGPASPWLSAAAGTAIAYVFVYLMPRFAGIQADFGATPADPMHTYFRRHAYVVALAGFTFYFWVMWADEFTRERGGPRSAGLRPAVLALRVVGLSAYCMQIGYLFADLKRPGPLPVILGTTVLAFHFLGLDSGFRRHYQALYDSVVRWVFSLSMFTGWLIGILTKVHPATVGLWSAFVGGGLIIIAMREELPREGNTRFIPFALGVVVTAALILTIERVPML